MSNQISTNDLQNGVDVCWKKFRDALIQESQTDCYPVWRQWVCIWEKNSFKYSFFCDASVLTGIATYLRNFWWWFYKKDPSP